MPTTPKPASTVMLLRDGPASPEVLLLERHARSSVLPAMYVFPGGGVEEADLQLIDRLGRFSAREARERLATVPAELALGYFVAAIRETFEESGLLLARRRGQSELLDGDAACALSHHRLQIQASRSGFCELVEAEDLELAVERLCAHGHWITPERVERRFDTIFFTALAPPGQRAQHDGVELTSHIWLRPEDALEQGRRGERQIIFPTACNLDTLCGFPDAEGILKASQGRALVRVLPRITMQDGRRVLEIPEETGYRMAPGFNRAGVP
jgi:8-oxo-dGTP pyrophosphatase MutT (NUDIX family)